METHLLGHPGPGCLKIGPAVAVSAEKKRWARRITLICVAGAALGLFSANPLLTACGLLVLPILFVLLWQLGEPPVLLFAATFQWLQVFVPVLTASGRAETLGEDMGFPELETAAWLGLAAIVVLAFGMRVGRGRRPIATQAQLKRWVGELSPARLMVAYFGALAFSLFATELGGELAGLRQGLLALGLIRWMVVFLVLWSGVNERRFRSGTVIVLGIEVILGFGGFFSTFKTILFLVAIVVLGNEVRLGRLLRPRFFAFLGVSLLLMAYWQAVKDDYRAFLNQGTQSQAVLVSPKQRLAFLADKTLELSPGDVYSALEPGLERLGYIDFFALSLRQVPEFIPYQHGRLWGEAIAHILTPRLLFPSKASVSDSDRTNEFSGVRVAGEDRGTSISLGYVADSYIDFGPVLMFVPIFLLGVLWGWAYRWLATRCPNGLLGLSAATTVILMGAILFEASSIKVLGGAVTNIVVLSVLLAFWSRPIWRLLSGR